MMEIATSSLSTVVSEYITLRKFQMNTGNEFRCYEMKIEESEKAGSCQVESKTLSWYWL